MDQRKKKRSKTPEKRVNGPEVNYTPPAPINSKKIILQVVSVLAVAVAIFLGLSIFFKVKTVTVSGNSKYSAKTIMECAGIVEGDSLLTINKAKVAAKIIHDLPYIESVRIGIKLPDQVFIEVTESDVVYAVRDTKDAWWLIDSGGKVVDSVNKAAADEHTLIKGFQLLNPERGEMAAVKEQDHNATDNDGDKIPVITTNAERLKAALEIAVLLEDNKIAGAVDYIDVSDLLAIELSYNAGQYLVYLGDDGDLHDKIVGMKKYIDEKGSQKGILDITFEEDRKVSYRPYSS